MNQDINEANLSSEIDRFRYYCPPCELPFNGTSDNTAYDQAPCPKCGHLAMTLEFHLEELKRLGRSGSMFRGHGYWVFVFYMGYAFGGQFITDFFLGDGYYVEHVWPQAIVVLLVSVACWGIGTILNRKAREDFIDQQSAGLPVLAPNYHTFFWIPMQWWGPITIAFAVYYVLTGG